MLPDLGELWEVHPDVVVSERRKHKLFLKRARQQIGQIPQTLQTKLGAHASSARQRVTATSSYRLVSVSTLDYVTYGWPASVRIITISLANTKKRYFA